MSNNGQILVESNIKQNKKSFNECFDIKDLITCKLVVPFHVLHDPRMLECGTSVCLKCIESRINSESILSCPNCNNMHSISNSHSLIVNKNLQSFINSNLKQINENFNNQLEDSICASQNK